jgi:hypothetical protein
VYAYAENNFGLFMFPPFINLVNESVLYDDISLSCQFSVNVYFRRIVSGYKTKLILFNMRMKHGLFFLKKEYKSRSRVFANRMLRTILEPER